MAVDKTTKKAPAASRRKAAKQAVEVKSLADLQKDLAAKQQGLLESRLGHRAGELVNPRAITQGRKEVARLKTAIRALELKGDN